MQIFEINEAACLHVKASRLETARDWITVAENMNGHRREAWANYSVGKRKKPMTIQLEVDRCERQIQVI